MTNPFLDEKAAAANNPFIGLDDGIEPTRPGPAVISAQERQPDAWVNAKRRGQQLGIAPEIVERNPAEVKRLELLQSLDKMRRENPSLADWMMRDDNLTVAQDDTDALSSIATKIKDVAGQLPSGFNQSVGYGLSGLGDLNDAFARGSTRFLRNIGLTPVADVLEMPIPEWMNPSNAARKLGDTIAEQSITLPKDRRNIATDVSQGLGNLIGQVVVSRINPTTGVALMAGQGAQQQAQQAEEAGATTEQKDRAVVLGSVITAASEKLGLDMILERLPPQVRGRAAQWIFDKAIAGGVEATQEAGEQVAQNLVAGLIYDPNADIMDGVRQNAEVGGAVGVLGRMLFGPGYRMSRERGQQENEQVDTLTKIVQQSKTWQRDPVKMENAIASLKGAGVENVYLPGEAVMTLYQSSPEMAQVFEAAGVSRDKVSEAILTGADLSVPMETYLTRIAPKYHGELGKYARLSPDTITESDPDATDEQNAAVERFLASVNDAPPEGDVDMRVYNDVLGQLLGTYSQADAEVMASVVNAMFRDGIARRAGVDPMELYQRYGLRVVDEMKRRYPPDRVHPEFDADLERLRTGDIPTEDEALGPTIGEFLSERGIRSAPNEPMSGEIRRLAENDRFARTGRRRLVREDDPNALTLDYAREAAVEAGYLPEGSDINDLLDALENDARPISPANPNAHETRLRLTSLADELDRQGLDVNALSNGEIRRALMGGVATDPNMMNFDQSGDAAFTESDYRPEVVSWAREKFGEMVAPNGRPAWQNFVAWFGDSKVVDEQGRPLVVYHGTNQSFDSFSDERHGRNTSAASSIAFFFTEDAREANEYAELAGRTQVADAVNVEKRSEEIQREISRAESRGDWDAAERLYLELEDLELGAINADPSGQNIMPVYLSIQNPMVLDMGDGFDGHRVRDAIAEAKAAGHDGLKLLNVYDPVGLEGREAAGLFSTTQYVVFRPEQIKSAIGNRGTFDPSNPSILNQQRRGYLQFGADRKFTIGLTEARDLSTFMHEIGHLGLEIMSDMAATDPVFAKEFGILTRWWQENADAVIATSDREVRDAINAAGGADFLRTVAADFRGDYGQAGVAAKTALHEYFARGFERYLAEGKPPTPELARPFSRFKAWLKAIYKSLVNLNVDLNDEVRGFMARMIAGDEAVVEAERASVSEPLFKEAARAGMSEAKFKAYLELQAKAHEEAEARVTAEAYREVMREREAWWREESRRVEAEVRAELEALPVYRAWEALARNREPNGTPLDTPQVKLSKDWLVDRYGHAWVKKNLLRKQVYSADGGVHGDVVAPMFGFNTGSELVEALSNAQPLAKAVRVETQNRMRERYGDMRNDGTLPEKAMRAVHNSRRVKVIEAEIAALARLANEPAMTAKQARDWATRQLAGRTVRDVVPYIYLRAERKAAREAVKAATAGKMAEALAASRRRLVNAVMYDEAAKVRDQFDRRSKWIKSLAKPKAQERLGKAGAEFRDQINGLLHIANVRPLSEAEQARQKPLRAFVEQLQEQGEDTAVTEAVLALSESGRPMAMRDMTVGQFSDLYAAVKNLKHIATNTGKLLAAADKATLDAAAEAMALRAAETHPDRLPEMLSRRDATVTQEAVERLRRLATELDRPENIIEALDGGESGPWHTYYLEALNGAENVAIGLRRRVGTALRSLRKSMPDGFMRSLEEKVALPHGIGEVSRGTLLGMVLNTGNAQNLQRLRDGGIHVNGQPITLNDQQVQDLRDLLTPDEARYVQGLWDAVNSLWPDIAALQTEMSGIPPEKVEAQEFTAAGVAMRGGYWPLVYDHGKSDVGERQADDDALRIMMGQTYTRATTPKGHTKSRVENMQAPLLLDFGAVMSRHLDNVMTDIAYRKAVKDTVRLLRHPKVKDAIIGRLGRAAYDNLKGQVAYAVSANDALGAGGWRWLVSKVVSNSAMSALALRPDIALGNYGSALLQALDRVGVKSMLRGMWQNATSRSELTQKVSALSPMMAERLGEIDENYRRELALAQGKRGYGEAYRRVMMTLHRFADHEVTRAAWWGRYQEALAAGETSAEAVRLADKLIRQTQTSTARKDVSPIERDPAFRESRIFMGPMFVVLGRLRAAARGEGATRTVGARAASLMLQMFMAPAVFMLLAGRWPEDDDDDGEIGLGEWSMWLAVNTLLFPLQAVPILREAAGSIEAWATDRPINPRAAPTAQAAAGLAKASKSIAKNIENYGDTGEFDWYDMTRDLATMAGPLTGAPAGQIRVTTKTIEAIQDDPDRDKTELARMALYGPPRQ